ncbi:MAG: tyrosine-type recombinase/integrase [Candidatus Paceibacterota bacterium]|jgi:integrase
MKLPNGFGTVYKLAGRRRKLWIARKTVGWTTVIDKKTGKEKHKQLFETVGYYETKEKGIEALVAGRINPIAPNADITLGGLYKEWSTVKYEEEISRQTIDNYKAGWKHIKKHENDIFKDLRTSHWQSIINKCRIDGMSKSSLSKIKLVVGMLYDYAIDNKITDQNLGKKIKIKKEDSAPKKAFTDLEFKAIEKAAADGMEWADTIMILLDTGMRISEMILLTKFSINIKEMLITGGVKTDAGKDRIIPIHPRIQPYIQKWYGKGGDRLICYPDGKTITTRKYREDLYRPTLKNIGVRVLDPHSCRHTFGTRLSNAGANTKAIQDLMGHADYSTTANIYTHPNLEELRKAINVL